MFLPIGTITNGNLPLTINDSQLLPLCWTRTLETKVFFCPGRVTSQHLFSGSSVAATRKNPAGHRDCGSTGVPSPVLNDPVNDMSSKGTNHH